MVAKDFTDAPQAFSSNCKCVQNHRGSARLFRVPGTRWTRAGQTSFLPWGTPPKLGRGWGGGI